MKKLKTHRNSMKKQKNLIKNLYSTIPGLCRHKSTSNKTTSWLLIRTGWVARCMLSLWRETITSGGTCTSTWQATITTTRRNLDSIKTKGERSSTQTFRNCKTQSRISIVKGTKISWTKSLCSVLQWWCKTTDSRRLSSSSSLCTSSIKTKARFYRCLTP